MIVSVRGGLGCKVSIVTSYKSSDVLLVPLSTGVLSELKMMASFFVKSAEQFELHGCPIDRSLVLFKFEYVWGFVAVDGDIGIGRFP